MRKFIISILDMTVPMLSFYILLHPEWLRHERILWLIIGYVISRLSLTFWPMLKKTPFIEITDCWIVINGTRFERGNILSGRVLSIRVNGEIGRYIEIAFKKPPPLSIGWRLSKYFDSRTYPLRCANGTSLSREPRIILPMKKTNLTDSEIEHAFSAIQGRDSMESVENGAHLTGF